MLVACRLAGLSALGAHYAGGVAVAQLSALGLLKRAARKGRGHAHRKQGEVTAQNVAQAENARYSSVQAECAAHARLMRPVWSNAIRVSLYP